jgi:hypothetical protein
MIDDFLLLNNFLLGISLAALPKTPDVRLMNPYTVLRVDRTAYVLFRTVLSAHSGFKGQQGPLLDESDGSPFFKGASQKLCDIRYIYVTHIRAFRVMWSDHAMK